MPLAESVGRNTASSKGSTEKSLLLINNTQKMKARGKEPPVQVIPSKNTFYHKS